MGEKVFLLRDADVSGKKLLWDAGLEVVVAKGAGESAWIEEMQREQPAAILTRADRVSAAMMDACPGLKAIGKQASGWTALIWTWPPSGAFRWCTPPSAT